jgi:hypothetical protein
VSVGLLIVVHPVFHHTTPNTSPQTGSTILFYAVHLRRRVVAIVSAPLARVHKAIHLYGGTEFIGVNVAPVSHRRLHGESRGEKFAVKGAKEAVEEGTSTTHSRPVTQR